MVGFSPMTPGTAAARAGSVAGQRAVLIARPPEHCRTARRDPCRGFSTSKDESAIQAYPFRSLPALIIQWLQ